MPENSVFHLEGLLNRAKAPAGVSLEYVSKAKLETGKLASDLAFAGREWLDLDESKYWKGVKRPRSDKSLLLPEAIVRVEDAYINRFGDVVTSSGIAFGGHGFGTRPHREPVDMTKVAGSLSGATGSILLGPRNYGHWILQRLPRLLSITNFDSNAKLINSVWGDESLLAQAGLSEDSIIRFPWYDDPEVFYHVDSVYLSTHLAKPSTVRVMEANRLQRVVHQFTAGINPDDSFPELLYIARAEDDFRTGATNKAEIRQMLEERGFRTWYPASEPIAKQIQYLRAAKVVVSEVGSQALTSMFAGPDTAVIILAPNMSVGAGGGTEFDPTWRTWQRVVCEARGQHFAQIVCSDIPAYKEWSVEIDRVKGALDTYPHKRW